MKGWETEVLPLTHSRTWDSQQKQTWSVSPWHNFILNLSYLALCGSLVWLFTESLTGWRNTAEGSVIEHRRRYPCRESVTFPLHLSPLPMLSVTITTSPHLSAHCSLLCQSVCSGPSFPPPRAQWGLLDRAGVDRRDYRRNRTVFRYP